MNKINKYKINVQEQAASQRTSLEDLGAATCKLVNFVDHKI